MEKSWIEDDSLVEAIDDLLLNLQPHLDHVLDRALAHVSIPSQDPDIMLFGVLGNFVAGYSLSRSEGETSSDAYHRGLAAVLSNETVANLLRKYMVNGAQMVIERGQVNE
jgi:hypothetical protein